MIARQLRPCGIGSPSLLAAFRAVPRERFVLPERAALAYVDAPQPIGPGRAMPAPLTLARLLERASVGPGERALVVGAGTGYAAALLARLGARVVALEADPGLAARARTLLAGEDRVEVVEGPLEAGAPAQAPFDLILVDGAVERFPDALADQLAAHGRVVAVMRGEDGVGRAVIGVRSGRGIGFDAFAEAPAPLLAPFRRPPAFRF